ncbi:MAG: ATP-binding protein [Fimbriimonadales bacterium]|nr:ATP-binding protein [Fimbriimonadales bacterium]
MTYQPAWLTEMEQAFASGAHAIILTGNTTDFVFNPYRKIPTCMVRYYVAQLLDSEGYDVYLFSQATGLQRLRPDKGESPVLRQIADPFDVRQVLQAFSTALRQRDAKLALIVDYADHLAPLAQGTNAMLAPEHQFALQTFHQWGVDDSVRTARSRITLISHENQLHSLLTQQGSGYRSIHIPLPSTGERRGFTEQLLFLREHGREREFALLDSRLPLTEFAELSSGLRLRDIEALFRYAAAHDTHVCRTMVRQAKSATIRQLAGGMLEVLETPYGVDQIGGQPHLKAFVRRLGQRWRAGAPDLPAAIIFAGVPGVGKSYSVRALAHELNLPCLAFRNIREQWVGASERNLELVLRIIESLAPCVVFIDEIDQMLGQRSTSGSSDAGTSERMLARLWEFMGSMRHRGRILWVAATNRPDLLDAATLDRFQVVIPVLHPTPDELPELLPILAKQIGRQLDGDVNHAELARMPSLQTPTVRALQEVVARAAEFADEEKGNFGEALIGNAHLQRAAQLYKPNYNPLLHEFIALTAVQMTTFADMTPWHHGATPNDYIRPLLREDGSVDLYALQERLRTLQMALQWERQAKQV